MPVKPRPDAKKAEADRLQALVLDLLREEENKYCADCDAKGPRWTSWNIGVFLCIRCAGIHRNLGVHLSKVKSVNLDSWTGEQVQSMRVMGNAKAKAVYEAELPDHFRRPQSDQALEQFIRAKYEHKRYIMKDWVPPRIDVDDLPKKGECEQRPRSQISPGDAQQNVARLPAPQSATGVAERKSPLGKTPSLAKDGQSSATSTTTLANDFQLLDLSAPQVPVMHANLNLVTANGPTLNSTMTQSAPDVNDLFGPIVSAHSPTSPTRSGNSFAPFSSASPGTVTSQPSLNASASLGDLASVQLQQSQTGASGETGSGDLLGTTKKSNVDIMALFGNAAPNANHSMAAPVAVNQMNAQPMFAYIPQAPGPTPMFAQQRAMHPAGHLPQQQAYQQQAVQQQQMHFPGVGNAGNIALGYGSGRPAQPAFPQLQQQAFMNAFPHDAGAVGGFGLTNATAAAFAAASPFANPPPTSPQFAAAFPAMPAVSATTGGFDAFFGANAATVNRGSTTMMPQTTTLPHASAGTGTGGNATSLVDLWQ